MMIALIKAETIAINTAKPSAYRVKLNILLILAVKLSGPASITVGRIAITNRRGIKASASARRFRRPVDIRPARGKINAPIHGTSTTQRSINRLSIIARLPEKESKQIPYCLQKDEAY